jgi:ATP/maltotriose-dependent transcriptional regulator MalT
VSIPPAEVGSGSLADVAFGPDPGRWPLPAARSPEQLWLRAVSAGGQGRYATARADLTELTRAQPSGRWRSLALSAHASFLRQLGWHGRAHDADGPAWLASAGDPEAGVDALSGLAADALGVGRLAASAVLLARAEELARLGVPDRQSVRLAWVHAELAMAGGDGAAAVRHARRAVELAAQLRPAAQRHRVKSDTVLAAALCCAGDLDASRAVADHALADADTHGLVPLRWALACLLSDIGSQVHSAAAITEVRDRSAQVVTRRGGQWKMR